MDSTLLEDDQELGAAIRREYQRWWDALPAHDFRTLQEVLAEDWLYTDQFGATRGRSEYIALVEQAIRPGHSTVTVDLAARRYGSVAHAFGRFDVRGIIAGHQIDIKLRFTSLWCERDGRWVCHAQHTTEIGEAPW